MGYKPLLISGTRPNYIKASAIHNSYSKTGIKIEVLNTGQHYDPNMSSNIINELNLPIKYNLSSQTSNKNKLIESIKGALEKIKPTHVFILGDVNSSLAACIAAKQLGIKIIHVESGLRSHNWVMEEEVNRFIIDHMSDYLFVTEESGLINLECEKIDMSRVYLVGNVMIDTLRDNIKYTHPIKTFDIIATFHRKENIENADGLEAIEYMINAIVNKGYSVGIFAHPNLKLRTTLNVYDPLTYHKFISYLRGCKTIITDSGGVQEEAAYLGTPCITYRTETERPFTLYYGNIVSKDLPFILECIENPPTSRKGIENTRWGDGQASNRIIEIMRSID